MYAAHNASLYNAHPLLRDLTTLLEVIQLMSIAGYEADVCVCFFMYKTLCAAFKWLSWDARSCPYVCLYCAKKLLNYKKVLEQEQKTFKNEQKVGMLL